jgi:hypothetical protein
LVLYCALSLHVTLCSLFFSFLASFRISSSSLVVVGGGGGGFFLLSLFLVLLLLELFC